jgi:hypothetical protein
MDDPLTRVTAQISAATHRCRAVSVVLALGVLALVHELAIGVPLTVIAGVSLAVMLARVGALRAARDRQALDLIAHGRGQLPVTAIARARRRLLDPAERERLAETLEVIRAEVEHPVRPVRPLYRVPVVRAVSSELGEVARLVREDGGLRGLASAEQLVTDGCSPLYGDAELLLRQELGRIRFLLADEQRR